MALIYQHGSYKNYGYIHLNLTRNNVNKTQNNLWPLALGQTLATFGYGFGLTNRPRQTSAHIAFDFGCGVPLLRQAVVILALSIVVLEDRVELRGKNEIIFLCQDARQYDLSWTDAHSTGSIRAFV